jgi:hypothetical protein
MIRPRPLPALLLLLGLSLGHAAFAATMPAVRMKFIDAETGHPVRGAHVLFHAGAREGTFTGHGGVRVNLFIVEARTNEAGEINLPAQEFKASPFTLNTNYDNPTMVVFMPGYSLVNISNNRRIIAERQDVTHWEYNGQTIKMRRAGTELETRGQVSSAVAAVENTYRLGYRDVCGWKQLPHFLVAVDRAANEWNAGRRAAPESDPRLGPIASPLHHLLLQDKHYAERGCGSPKAFFDTVR